MNNENLAVMKIQLTEEERIQLRRLVDDVWNEATESEQVPSTCWADKIIDKWVIAENDKV